MSVNFSQFGGPAAVSAVNNSNVWTATYTITAGSIDSTSCNVVVSATDSVGNITTASGNANVSVDNILPTVTAANISISGTGGGAFKAGDTVTAAWNNTASGDHNTDTIASVTVNFSQFGGPAAVVANNNGNTWTTGYTIPLTATGGSNLNVVVTATDNAGNATTTSGNANAMIGVPPGVTAGPSAATVNAGGAVSFSAAAGGNPTPTVKWQVSTDNGTTWNPAPGTNNQPTYSFTASAAQNGYDYEAVFTNAVGTATTAAATLTVDYITTQPVSQTVDDGQTVSFSVASSNPGDADTVQWEESATGGTSFNLIAGATSATYSFVASVADNNYQYLAVFSNAAGTLTSGAGYPDRCPRADHRRLELCRGRRLERSGQLDR